MNHAEMRLEPHKYTSGRWLRRDKKETVSRYIQFDFDALCQKVIDLCSGASAITACQKLEGGFNRVFIFTLNNCQKLVARLPSRLAGPSRLITLSEVATIRYLQEKTSIPIPQILDWNHDSYDVKNPVGSEYIIMEHAKGVPLRHKWPKMAGDQQVRCIDAIYRTMKEGNNRWMMVSVLDPTAALDTGTVMLGNGGLITMQGKTTGHLTTRPLGLSIDYYCDGLIDAGLSRVPPVNVNVENRPIYQGSPKAHLALLESARSVLKQMSMDPRIRSAAAPLLFHPDLHLRNIFVSEDNPSIITGVIDWQSASVEPAFWYADEIPDFATANEVCTKTFALSSEFLTPKLAGPRLMDDSLFRPFRYSFRTWKDGAVALRHDLIETARLWKDLGFDGQCPYPLPTPEELANHQKEYKLFEAAQNLRSDSCELLNTAPDGWVPPESWEETQVAHKEFFEGALQAVVFNPDMDDDEPVKDEATLRAIWPFDLDQ